ncbi:hypothetical protein Aperf_G00000014212 [Anoplocephala perfoliata]
MDVNAPFNDVEIHMLTMLLDPNTEGSIQIARFAEGIFELCKEEEINIMKLSPSPLIKPMVRWVRVHFKNATLASIPFHPLHFNEDVPSLYTTDFLIDVIRRNNHVCAPSVKLYLKRGAAPPQEIERMGVTLDQLGVKGGTKLAPEEVTILYQSECTSDRSLESLCPTSIDDCYLLWEEAPLWLEEVVIKEPKPSSSAKTKSNAESSEKVSESSHSDDSDASSVVSLATYLTVEKRASRRAKRMRRLAKKFEQRVLATDPSKNNQH